MSARQDTPDMERIRALLRAREARRAAGETVPEDPAERVARALAAEMPDPSACATIEAQLPEFVAAELRGADATRLFPEVQRHLLVCEQCAGLHADLLELELGPELTPLPVPPLAALRWPTGGEALRQFVAQRARQMLARLARPIPAGFDELITSFFETIEELGERVTWSPRTARAFSFADEETSYVARLLLTVWQATLAVRDRLAERPGIAADRAGFEQLLRTSAHEAARRNRLGRDAAQRFADAFVKLALAADAHEEETEP